MQRDNLLVFEKKDFLFDRRLFTEKCALPTIQIAKALWSLVWYIKITPAESSPIDEFNPVIQKRLELMATVVDKFSEPETLGEATEFINYFTDKKGLLECQLNEKQASTVEMFLSSFMRK